MRFKILDAAQNGCCTHTATYILEFRQHTPRFSAGTPGKHLVLTFAHTLAMTREPLCLPAQEPGSDTRNHCARFVPVQQQTHTQFPRACLISPQARAFRCNPDDYHAELRVRNLTKLNAAACCDGIHRHQTDQKSACLVRRQYRVCCELPFTQSNTRAYCTSFHGCTC